MCSRRRILVQVKANRFVNTCRLGTNRLRLSEGFAKPVRARATRTALMSAKCSLFEGCQLRLCCGQGDRGSGWQSSRNSGRRRDA
jgi:hypothetical protein